MYRFLAVLLATLLLTACGEVTVEAEAGRYAQLAYEPVESETEYTIEMKVLEVREDDKWTPFLAFGMLDLDTKSKLEVFLNKRHKSDAALTAGYRYIENDKLIYMRKVTDGIPIGQTIHWNLSWNADSEFQIQLEGLDSVKANTNLGKMVGYVTISGAKGEIHRY